MTGNSHPADENESARLDDADGMVDAGPDDEMIAGAAGERFTVHVEFETAGDDDGELLRLGGMCRDIGLHLRVDDHHVAQPAGDAATEARHFDDGIVAHAAVSLPAINR
ncbi:protein of unknown function (plasmid) [Shinella sp. WSC3-e]|nr:protein of unknown function [Shinella sp. WSC3-e]